MATQKVVVEGSSVAASQLADLFRQIKDGSLGHEEIQALLEHRNPFKPKPVQLAWSVTSDGQNIKALIKGLEDEGDRTDCWVEYLMRRRKFVITVGVTYQLAIIKGIDFPDDERLTKNIFAEAKRRGCLIPPAEVAPLLRKKYSQAELGFPLVAVFHEPICDAIGCPRVFGLNQRDDIDGLSGWLTLNDFRWDRANVFVFLAPPVQG